MSDKEWFIKTFNIDEKNVALRDEIDYIDSELLASEKCPDYIYKKGYKDGLLKAKAIWETK